MLPLKASLSKAGDVFHYHAVIFAAQVRRYSAGSIDALALLEEASSRPAWRQCAKMPRARKRQLQTFLNRPGICRSGRKR